ncbi:MAG: SagB family peptide dehydrogenase [Burkholderiales bacterium]
MPTAAPLRLSPYCVFHVDPSGETVHLVHGRHGSRFSLPLALWLRVLSTAVGDRSTVALADAPADVRDAVAAMVEEEILIAAASPTAEETPDPFRNRLTPIELAFHSGVDEGGYFADRVDTANVPPPTKPAHDRGAIALPEPPVTGDAMRQLDAALSARRSRRRFGIASLPLARLSVWLSATLRTRRQMALPDLGVVSQRHYPSAGARHPLEGYVLVRDVESLPAGLYHYHPLTHTLQPMPATAAHCEALFAMAGDRLGRQTQTPPHVLLAVTAVFARTCWKYRGMPYHAILLETGALYQTASLAASALGLAGCPVGAYPERAIAEILGVDRLDEAPVGLFALGVPPLEPLPKRVVACRPVAPSPFGPGAGEVAVELTFSDGVREILPLAAFVLQRSADGRLRCEVGSDPGVATFDAAAAEAALRLSVRPAH